MKLVGLKSAHREDTFSLQSKNVKLKECRKLMELLNYKINSA
jgi:hypothetical protein